MSISKSPSGDKTYFTTANPYEKAFGYHRAVRKGPCIFISGTTAVDPTTGELEGKGDAYKQATVTLRRISEANTALGGKLGDIVRIRMFVGVSLAPTAWIVLRSGHRTQTILRR
jgi:enamine deaminase RidA (YjgF/YER057c/UK114 family)